MLPLVVICSIVAQTSTLPAIWRSIDFRLVWPFLLAGRAGVPLGTRLVANADPGIFKLSVGALLLVFPAALYFNRRPMAFHFGGRIADAELDSRAGSLAAWPVRFPILWASVRGWGKDERRGVFQAFNWTVLSAALCMQAGTGFITREIIRPALLAMPRRIRRVARRANLSHAKRQ